LVGKSNQLRRYDSKAKIARFGPAYRWARRLRALFRYLARRPHDPDFAAFAKLPGSGLFLDVGASIGQSALSFRVFNRRSPILSLEPLPGHRGDLRFVGQVIDNHSYMMVGASEASRTATLFVPTMGSYELSAESSLDRGAAAAVLERLADEGADRDRLALLEIPVELRRLDDLELDPSFVKIDVEGAELEVLNGMRETLSRSQPVLMIERSDRFPQVAAQLHDAGYEPYLYDALIGEMRRYSDEQTVNVFFLPSRDRQAASPSAPMAAPCRRSG
jgi:FkbM family methyltransferase